VRGPYPPLSRELLEGLDELKPRQHQAIVLRFGLSGKPMFTQQQTAEWFGITQQSAPCNGR
jgi:DNA-directed RNA polymerase sigma subunit (sigma70/sigma32)